ncbi:MAG: cyclic nucleotide-binding domain-containing protein, partial [Syntrophales bacterium]|nr:cyclic nucleotide-binding domain-containing protein [Syntrophales bacterium]
MTEGQDQSADRKVDGLILHELGQEVSAPAGTRLVTQGEDPEYFFIIKTGKVKVFRETEDGIRTDLTELGAESYFGEVALVTGQPRTASVETVEDSELIKVSKAEFDHLLDHNPQLARHIIHQLSQWLITGDRRLESETVHQVKLRQISWFDYLLMIGLSIVMALVVNIYNDNGIPLIQDWGLEAKVPEITLQKALEDYKNKTAIFVDARKSAFYSQEHIKGATNLPLILFDLFYPLFNFTVSQTEGAKDKTIIVYGGAFSRRFDLELARQLQLKGMKKVAGLADYGAWLSVFPVEGKEAKTPAALPLGLAGFVEWLPVG